MLQDEVHSSATTYDALGRPVVITSPDGSVTRHAYNTAGLLESVQADVHGTTTTFVGDIDYDVYGRRASVTHGNGTTTSYAYDPASFRLTRIRTVRATDAAVVQDLQYEYDVVGNIVELRDGAQPELFFNNAVVSADQQFVYDAWYRLVEATGREHASQGQPSHSELTPGAQPHANDPSALRRYRETYEYDAVGNIEQVQHQANGGNWTRGYAYAADGNRLLSNSLPGETPSDATSHTAQYGYNVHGSMTAMPHLAGIDWDHGERMRHVDLGGGGDVFFQYDSAGTRVLGSPPLRLAKEHWQHGLTALQSLNLGLLVHAEHERVVRRVHVQANNVANLFDEEVVGAQREGSLSMRLKPERPPHSAD